MFVAQFQPQQCPDFLAPLPIFPRRFPCALGAFEWAPLYRCKKALAQVEELRELGVVVYIVCGETEIEVFG